MHPTASLAVNLSAFRASRAVSRGGSGGKRTTGGGAGHNRSLFPLFSLGLLAVGLWRVCGTRLADQNGFERARNRSSLLSVADLDEERVRGDDGCVRLEKSNAASSTDNNPTDNPAYPNEPTAGPHHALSNLSPPPSIPGNASSAARKRVERTAAPYNDIDTIASGPPTCRRQQQLPSSRRPAEARPVAQQDSTARCAHGARLGNTMGAESAATACTASTDACRNFARHRRLPGEPREDGYVQCAA